MQQCSTGAHKRIGEFDRDFLAWCNGKQFGATYRNYFDHSINLTNPDLKLGSVAQQTADFAARLSALDKAMGGGAITIDSAKALAAFHGQQPDKPESWIDNPSWIPASAGMTSNYPAKPCA